MNAVRIELILAMLGIFSNTHKHTHTGKQYTETLERTRG